MLSFLKEKARFRRCKLLMFANMFLCDLLSSNLSILSFLNLSKELIIDYLVKNESKIENANKKTKLKILKDASLFR